MKTCEKCWRIYEIQDLGLEVHALIDVLERALKCDEFENEPSINNLYLVEIIRKKFEKISITIQKVSF